MSVFFTNMIGTLAVILLVASFVGGSSLLAKFKDPVHRWRYVLLAGLMGGLFGIYGNISGLELSGAIISVRDIGPMLSGFIGGPLTGLIAGFIAGAHRLTMGGITAQPCIIATCCIGSFCGFLYRRYRERLIKPAAAFIVGVCMELFHLGVLLLMVRPFETGLYIVKTIGLPFVSVNALGFTLMISIMNYIEKQRAITLEQQRLASELSVATVIQHSLLPPITEDYPGRPEFSIAASMEPAKEVGGDFYDYFFVGKDKLAFLIADVSGKGIPAALFMATAKLTLQNCLRDIDGLAEAVCQANESLCRSNEAEMFVTVWIGVLDIASGEVEYVCAGHNPPVLLSGGKTEYIRRRGGFVLAGMEGIPYRKSSLRLSPGDKLFLYTDGITEAENSVHELFGEARLEQCLAPLAGEDPQAIIEKVKEAVARHVNGHEQFDDMTMFCLKYTGPETGSV